jgi:ribosomal protein L15E
MSFLQRIKKLFSKKKQLIKSNKPKYLKEPIQTYDRKEQQWIKSFYIDYSHKNVSPNQSQSTMTSSLQKNETRKELRSNGQKSKG